MCKNMQPGPATPTGLLQEHPSSSNPFHPSNCTEHFDASALGVAMHALCVLVNNITLLFLYFNIISVNKGL